MKTLELKQVAEEQKQKKIFTVFIVDDDTAYLTALAFRLKENHKDAKVFCYSSGEACLRNLDQKPDAIILDYYLDSGKRGALTGIRTLKKIKDKLPDIPIIMLSGQNDMNVALETYNAGAYTYIIKDKEALFSIERIIEDLKH